jgi:predicted TPR repeat methyltransferase
MKIKNQILASMLTRLGVEVKAELVVDDANGTSITFPEISEISEIAVGVAVSAPDGTYAVADGDNTITMVVVGGLVESLEVTEPETIDAVVDAEVLEVLGAVVEANNKANASIVALQNELKELKVSLKHEPNTPAPVDGKKNTNRFKIVG